MKKEHILIALGMIVLTVSLYAPRVATSQSNDKRFSDTCLSISQLSRPNWSTMGEKSLIQALKLGNHAFIRQAIWLGADAQRLKDTPWYGYGKRERLNVLLMAAVASDQANEVAGLLKQGANPNVDAQMDDLMTPAITASRCASVGVMGALLRAGANPNAHIDYGADGGATIRDSTALRWASDRGSEEIVDALINASANPNVQETIFDNRFLPRIRRGVAAILTASTPRILIALLKAKANPNMSNWLGETALMKAAQRGDSGECLILLRFGASRGLRNSDGKTASNLAMSAGHRDVANLIDGWGHR